MGEATQPFFVDLPEILFPIHIKWIDMETGELVREDNIEGPGVLIGGGFAKGRKLWMDLKFGDGSKIEEVVDGRI